YVILKVNAEKPALDEFDRLAKLNQNVLRHLITVAQD
ncbi:MAG: 30S ribosomal protein S6, partial [Bacilli bacterium]|nr:30S ribosomal protein S6 [Bacilli bacterium]